MRRQFFSYCIYVLVLLVVIVGCQKKEKKEKKVIRPVKTMLVAPPQSLTIRRFPGKILAGEEVQLAFEVSGRLVELPVKEGERVKKGQLVARVDPKKYKDTVNQMKAKYLEAKAQYLRAEKLVADNFISRARYDAVRATYSVATANYSTAQHDLADTTLRAPFSGVIAKTYVENYEYIKIRQPIGELHGTETVDVEIDVPEKVMINLTEQQKEKDAKYRPVAIFDARPKQEYPLSFKEVTTRADPKTQTFRIVFSMPRQPDINILPGMSVNVRVAIPDFNAAGKAFYVIPSSAVFMGPDQKSSVWIVDMKTMKTKRRPITVTRLADDNIRVLSGLKEGERVVIAGVHFLHEGEEVKLLKPLSEDEK